MSTDNSEQNDNPLDVEGEELSLQKLSEAYAEVMRQNNTNESNTTPADEFTPPTETDDFANVPGDENDPIDQLDRKDDSGCPISPHSIIESMLFVGAPSGVKLTAKKIAAAIRDVSPIEVKNTINELKQVYDDLEMAVEIYEKDEHFGMRIREDLGPLQDQYFGKNRPARLSQGAIDVMAIVAYNQPCSRQEVDKIRTKPSGSIVDQLVKRQILDFESFEGKKEKRLVTTDRFLGLFGLGSLDDLPQTNIATDLDELADF